MKLADLLLDDWIAIPLEAADLAEALRVLLSRLRGAGLGDPDDVGRLAEGLADGSAGELIRVNADVVLVIGRAEPLEGVSVTLGVATSPFRMGPDEVAGTARALLVLLTPKSLPRSSRRSCGCCATKSGVGACWQPTQWSRCGGCAS